MSKSDQIDTKAIEVKRLENAQPETHEVYYKEKLVGTLKDSGRHEADSIEEDWLTDKKVFVPGATIWTDSLGEARYSLGAGAIGLCRLLASRGQL